jgi:hypothetical protein
MIKRLSREEIERRLLELERSPRPGDLKEDQGPGAMCYMPAAPPDHWTYVCPACGKRTAYVAEESADRRWGAALAEKPSDGERRVPRDTVWDMQGLQSNLSLARRLPKRSGVSLDESPLCVFCRPDAEEYVPVLEVKLPGEAPRRLRFDWQDVVILRAFLKGSDRYEDGEDSESPLGKEVSRLRSLLLGDAPSQGEDVEE